MRITPFILFLLIGICSAQAQSRLFYAGLNSYLNSKYYDASQQFGLAMQDAEPEHKADIYYLEGMSQYFLRNYNQSLQNLDSAYSYYAQYSPQAVYYNSEDLLRYRVMNYEKLGDVSNEIAVLKQMLAENKNKWARDRLNSPRLGRK